MNPPSHHKNETSNTLKPGTRKHTTHTVCKERLKEYGDKAVGCCCTGHECKNEVKTVEDDKLQIARYSNIESIVHGELVAWGWDINTANDVQKKITENVVSYMNQHTTPNDLINEHFVSSLEDIRTSLEEENLAFHGRSDCKSCHSVEELTAAISKYKTKAQGEE